VNRNPGFLKRATEFIPQVTHNYSETDKNPLLPEDIARNYPIGCGAGG
jgi:hypothetical protein